MRSLLLIFALSIAVSAQTREIDPATSTMTIHVGKSGFFSAFGHNHTVRAPIAAGTVTTERGRESVQLKVDARQLTVLDPDVKAEERAEVQATMHGAKVLDSAGFPEIRFRSTAAKREGAGWLIEGELTLHGQTRPLTLKVAESGGRYTGSARFKQRDFGITPVAVAGGTVKVKDELRVEFEIAVR